MKISEEGQDRKKGTVIVVYNIMLSLVYYVGSSIRLMALPKNGDRVIVKYKHMRGG